jgi:Tetracyclin repressor-like, C-terminal domain
MKSDSRTHRNPKTPATDQQSAPRRPGRPRGSQGGISLNAILRTSYRLAKTVPLQELSIVFVAKTLGVTPALIHYYVGGRDWLTSGTMNLFYSDLLKKLPEDTGDWKRDIPRMAHTIYEHLVQHAGVAAYMVSHNRFRMWQLTAYGQREYGVEVLERLTACVAQAGCAPKRTGIYTHLIMEFVIGSAHRAAHHLFPSDHQEFLKEKLSKLDPERFPTLMLTDTAPISLGPESAFNEEMRLFMLGLDQEPKGKVAESVTRKRAVNGPRSRAARKSR